MPCATRYDVVIYGATGTTGLQAAFRLADRVREQPGLRWAIAGRNPDRLRSLHERLPAGVGMVVARMDDAASVEELVASTRVVLNMAGPYSLCSEALVRECARRGVDYVDITAETAHVRRMIDRYHADAIRSGAKIVPFCGFDSVPSDLGTLLVVDHFRARGRETREVRAYFHAFAGLNWGTMVTMLELWRRPDDMWAMQDPLLLNPAAWRNDEERRGNLDPVAPAFDPYLGRWVAPFFMGLVNTRVVRRSRALAASWEMDYGRGFRYQEYWDPGGPVSLLPAAGVAWGLALCRTMAWMPGAGEALAPLAAGTGQRTSSLVRSGDGFFRVVLVGIADDGEQAWAELSGRGDPSSEVTVTMVCEAALALALSRDELPGGSSRGGLLTPATALGPTLAERLRATGMRVGVSRAALIMPSPCSDPPGERPWR